MVNKLNLKSLHPIVQLLPEVKEPEVTPKLKKKLIWTGVALTVFLILGVISPIGLAVSEQGQFLSSLQQITASRIGTLATLGIGPIVMASIILQLLMGADIIQMDMNDPAQKSLFQGVQKLVAILFCFFEAGVYVASGFIPALGGGLTTAILILQIAIGGILIIFLDEVVSKYGIGSGVGLFIVAGVSSTIIWRAFSWVTRAGTQQFVGLIPQLMKGITTGNIPSTALFPLLFTIIIFLVAVYVQTMRVEVPLTSSRMRGRGTKYPLKFLYLSVIPVIFVSALFANVQLWGIALDGMGVPVLGTFQNNQPVSGIAYYLQSPSGALGTPGQAMATIGNPRKILQIITYTSGMVLGAIVFGKFWAKMSNMTSDDVADQLKNIGLHVPGFRRDKRVIKRVLDRYIPPLIVLSAISVGLLASIADLTGALGTGTGILLTVGILYQMYESLASEEAFRSLPGIDASNLPT